MVLTITDDFGLADLFFLGLTLVAFVLLIKNRKWLLNKAD
jgi:hypothetical protein